MARNNRSHRFTVYDLMEAKGAFADNPANADSEYYKGPIPYPRMLYHPKGEMKITQRAEIVKLPDGTIERLGEQKEIIYRVVKDEEEDKAAQAEGWWDHPSKALRAGGATSVPAMAPEGRVESLEEQIKRMQAELDSLRQPISAKLGKTL